MICAIRQPRKPWTNLLICHYLGCVGNPCVRCELVILPCPHGGIHDSEE